MIFFFTGGGRSDLERSVYNFQRWIEREGEAGRYKERWLQGKREEC